MVSANPRYLVALAGAAVVLASGVVGAAYVAGAGPFAGPSGPELTDFETTGAQCSTGNDTATEIELAPGDGVTYLTVNDTVEVPDLAYGVGNASVERTGATNYTLSVERLEPEEEQMGAQCVGFVGYTANVTVPQGADENFTVAVSVDGETAHTHTVYNGPDSSGVQSEASASDR